MIWMLPIALAVPREDVLENASQYASHVWTMTNANTTADCDSDYESDYSAGTYTGLPYDWGGYVDLDEFDDQIADGYGAGGHSWDGVLSCTTGVDCSGFVSKTWETGHYSTSTFDSVTSDIDWGDLERGDAINDAGSHVVLYTHTGEDGWPVFWEASGGASKVHINNDGGWSYVDGYQPIRFDDIEAGTSTGTSSSPRVISAFPYTDYGWTPGSASDVFDVYNCSDANESGPEMLYRFTTDVPGIVTAVVSDESGVDIDVYVLTAPSEDACLGRDDTEVSVSVDAGEVWLALDTYVGSQEYSGPYVLSVDFVATGEAPDEDTGTVDEDTGTPDTDDEDVPTPPSIFPSPGALMDLDEVHSGCGCATGGPGAGLGAVLIALLGLRRRG